MPQLIPTDLPFLFHCLCPQQRQPSQSMRLQVLRQLQGALPVAQPAPQLDCGGRARGGQQQLLRALNIPCDRGGRVRVQS